MQDYRKLKVWVNSYRLTIRIFRATSRYPRRDYGSLASQTRRAAQSIPATIAEGCGRDTGPDLARFLGMAIASTTELENHLIQARGLKLLSKEQYRVLAGDTSEVLRMLVAFQRRVLDAN